MILIKKLSPEDIGNFFSWRDANSYIHNMLRREVIEHQEGKRIIFIALDKLTIVGTVQFVPRHDDIQLADGNSTAYLQSLLVDKNYRRQGIGYRLVKAVEYEAIERNFLRLTIMVDSENSAALNLYQKMGFSLFKNASNIWQAKECCINCLEKNLG